MFRRRGTVTHYAGFGSSQELLRLAGKPFGTALRTEVVRLASVRNFGGRFFRNHHHSANGILQLWRCGKGTQAWNRGLVRGRGVGHISMLDEFGLHADMPRILPRLL